MIVYAFITSLLFVQL